jgi:hypothetical protein
MKLGKCSVKIFWWFMFSWFLRSCLHIWWWILCFIIEMSFIMTLWASFRAMYTYSYAIVILLYTLQLTSIKLCPLYTGLAVHTGRYTLQHCYFIVHLCTLQLTSIKLCPYQVVSFIYRFGCTYRSIHTTTLLFYYTLIHITSIKLCPLYTGLAVHTGSYTLQVSSYNKKYKYFLTNN